MHTVGSSSRRSPPREKSSPRWPCGKPWTPRTSRPARQRPLLETTSRPRLATWRTYRATTWWPRSTTRSCSSASGTARIRRGIRESSAEPDEDEEFLEDPVRESPDEPAVVGERGHVQLPEDRRVRGPTPAPRKAHLPGPRVALAFRPLAQEDFETVRAVAQDDHHRGGGFRLEFRFGELEGQQELP